MTTKDNSLFPTLLLILFIGLKLGRVISWSWWWVLSPLWISALIAVVVIIGVAVVSVVKDRR